MNELTELLENFWFVHQNDAGEYFRMKRALDGKLKKFINEFVGWNVTVNNKVVKLEKIPAEAKPFMGIVEFETPRDYCLLCALLIFLDDKFDGEQFLLTEMIESVEKIIGSVTEVDFTKFSDRKSLVRVLKFAQGMSLIKISDGSLENLENDRSKQILYENTGLSMYFSVNRNMELSGVQHYRDFETYTQLYTDRDTGFARTNRVYRRLLLQPAMYWESKDDPDSLYLKNQRRSIMNYLEQYIGGRLELHNGAAFYMLDENETFGRIHPSDKALSGFVLMMCAELRTNWKNEIPHSDTHKYRVTREWLEDVILKCKSKYNDAIGKGLRELSDSKFTELVTGYLMEWQLMEASEDGYALCDGIYKSVGRFPDDYRQKKKEEE